MFNKIPTKKSRISEKGFTLVEMMVSLTIFTIVLVVIMGSVITVVDVNRKARSLTVVMNDVNFSMESFTRSLRTGRLHPDYLVRSVASETYTSIKVIDQSGHEVEYEFDAGDGESRGKIVRKIKKVGESHTEDVSITSNQVDITKAEFTVFYGSDNKQPRIMILVEGIVFTSPTISSEFRIQTSISQRNLDRHYVTN